TGRIVTLPSRTSTWRVSLRGAKWGACSTAVWRDLPTAECAIGQGASEGPFRFRHRADGYLPPAKAEVRFVYALQHWLQLLEFSCSSRQWSSPRLEFSERAGQVR